jgi:SAM-dependent methyltransferase
MKNKELDWRIWNKDDSVEERTYSRASGELPEMESAKQLRQIIGDINQNESILDVGCAAGHYLRSIRQLNATCYYTGVDATVKYIDSAIKLHQADTNAKFINGDIYSLKLNADIVFCCNVLLHLPDLKVPLENLLNSFNKKLIVRTLLSKKTHLSQYLYSDKFDNNGNPTNFLFQNTYSFDYVENIVKNFDSKINLEFIEDKFDPELLQKESDDWRKKQGFATTSVFNNLQIAGDKIFRWGWFVCSK